METKKDKNNNTVLTDKQLSFVENYCNNGYNAAEAYKDSYPNCKGNYNKLGFENKSKQGIKDAINKYKAKITEKIDFNRDIAISLLNKNIEYLTPKAESGDTQAITALTAVIRELSAISNLHSNTSFVKSSNDDIPQSDKEIEAGEEAAKIFKLRLANG